MNPPAVLFRSMIGWAAAAFLGSLGILTLQIPGFPHLPAAQITAGIIGLGGGFSYALSIRAAGGEISRRNILSVAAAWSVSFILGVTPLFFSLGTPLKMMVNAFYSFAFCGALGGIFTGYRMRSFFSGAVSRDFISSVFLWSLSFGFASIVSNILGEGLQRFLPAWLAWFVGYEAMALIIGAAGGYAILLFERKRETVLAPVERIRGEGFSRGEIKRPVAAVILLFLPFYLNDLTNIFVGDWRLWLLIDFISVKLLPLGVLAWLIRTGEVGFSSLGLKIPSAVPFFFVLAVGALAGVFIDQNGYLLTKWCSGVPFGRMPWITAPAWRWADLTVGLALVSIVEELVFRGYLRVFLSRYTQRAWLVIGISAIAFGFIHWSGGWQQIVTTCLVGAVFMALYLRTHCLPAIMVSHYLVNFVDFSRVVPPSVFRFFQG